MASRKQRGWRVPGFGLPLRWPELKHEASHEESLLLCSALDASEDPKYCYTSRELTMLAWINELTDTPRWERQIFDPDFISKWKSGKMLTGQDATRAMADWCVDEVKYYAQDSPRNRIVPAIDGGVIKSDVLVDDFFEDELLVAVARLKLDLTSMQRPNQQRQIIDIVDPYLFPYKWAKTRTLRSSPCSLADSISRCGEGEVFPRAPWQYCEEREFGKYRNGRAWSNEFQWLPFDARFEDDSARITSYINNVHPIRQSGFYNVTEKLIDTLIPAFNKTLIDLKAPGYQNQRIHPVDYSSKDFISLDPRGPFRPPEQRAYPEYLNRDGLYDESMFVDLKKEFWNIGLQFVMHVREINLTEAQPEYSEKYWHIEGQNNERIAATATYILQSTNLTKPKLSFRRRINTEQAIAAKGSIRTPPFLPEIFRAKHGYSAVQTLGDVELRKGRVICHPNTFQTKISPIRLADPSKKGTLQLLQLHLIDPNRRMLSSAYVPCQKKDWWEDAVTEAWPRLGKLPVEVRRRVFELVDGGWPIGMEEAEEIRREFLSEREDYRGRHTRALEGYEEWDFDGEPGVGGEEGDDE